jgi:hypothetical protein
VNVAEDSDAASETSAGTAPTGIGSAVPVAAVLDPEVSEDDVRGADERAPRAGGVRRRFGWHGLSRVRRIATIVLLALSGLVSLLCVLLLIGCWLDDAAISSRTGHATAEVVSEAFNRTVIRFDTPDGAVRIPPDGVLYPQGLEKGQLVRVEYDTADPDLVRVAGRGAWLAYLPVATTLLGWWAVVLPTLWWLRRPSRAR